MLATPAVAVAAVAVAPTGAAVRAQVAAMAAAATRVGAALVPAAEEDSPAPAAVPAGTPARVAAVSAVPAQAAAMVAGPTVPQQPPVGHTAAAATAMVQWHPAPSALRTGRLSCAAMRPLGPSQRPTMARTRHGRMGRRDRLCPVIDRTERRR
ncbi:MAG TPA: hypothetical protein VGM97_10650 [Steroidobacteraceae bacterium]